MEQLAKFGKSALPHLLERVADVDPRVAAAAVRCLKQQTLTEMLQALRGIQHATPALQEEGARDEEDALAAPQADPVRDLHNSETAISMLVEYIENYMDGKLRIIERAFGAAVVLTGHGHHVKSLVGAFWPRAPALSHWSTIMNLRGGHHQPARFGALSLFKSPLWSPVTMQDLFVLVNSKVLCQGLRKAIEDNVAPMETMKNSNWAQLGPAKLRRSWASADSLLALAKCFEEAKNTFLDISKEVGHSGVTRARSGSKPLSGLAFDRSLWFDICHWSVGIQGSPGALAS
eukprot:Skav209200  [mRNA]  locus=scaffold2666:25925:35129:- [translate_table: standard]